jgi:hypothetical protein
VADRIEDSEQALASAASDGRPVVILGTTSVISEVQTLRESGRLAHVLRGID